MPRSFSTRLRVTVLAPYSSVKFQRGDEHVFSISTPAGSLMPETDAQRREWSAGIVAQFAAAFADIAIDIAWQSDSLNAQAYRLGPTAAHVRIYGGLARHRDIGPEGLALAIAHEIGHHKGGPPAMRHYHWLSTDRRADEWARTVGLPAVFDQAATHVARAGADQLFGALAETVALGTAPPCEAQQPCLACRARSFGATGRIASRECK
jgi:hypothetical protein